MKRPQKRSSIPTLPSALLLLLSFLGTPCFSQTKTVANFDSLSKQAAAARNANQLDQAVTLYNQALALRPKWAEGWWSLGTLEYDRNNYASAARAFRRLLPLAPNDGTAHAFLALCEFELGQDTPALRHIQEARVLGIANNQQLHDVTLYHEGVLLLRARSFKLAQSTFGALCREGVRNDQVLDSLAFSVLRVSPKDAPPHGTPGSEVIRRVGNAACLVAQKKFDLAKQTYLGLLYDFPNYPGLHYAFGLYFVEANDPQSAVEQFKQEIANDSQNIPARLEIAVTYYRVDSAAGLPYAQQAVQLNPHLPFAHYLLGLLYLDTDNYQKAIPELELAEKAFPKEAKIYFALGSAYSRAGRREDAAKARATFERLSKESCADSQPSY